MTCSSEGCWSEKIKALGLCGTCYNRDLIENPRKPAGPCEVRECSRLRGPGTKGLCGVHYKLSWKYGLNPGDLWVMINANDGVCPICSMTIEKGSAPNSGWCIDHDHSCCPTIPTCGQCNRGAICAQCNLMLGCSKDSPETLRAAARYLERYA